MPTRRQFLKTAAAATAAAALPSTEPLRAQTAPVATADSFTQYSVQTNTDGTQNLVAELWNKTNQNISTTLVGSVSGLPPTAFGKIDNDSNAGSPLAIEVRQTAVNGNAGTLYVLDIKPQSAPNENVGGVKISAFQIQDTGEYLPLRTYSLPDVPVFSGQPFFKNTGGYLYVGSTDSESGGSVNLKSGNTMLINSPWGPWGKVANVSGPSPDNGGDVIEIVWAGQNAAAGQRSAAYKLGDELFLPNLPAGPKGGAKFILDSHAAPGS